MGLTSRELSESEKNDKIQYRAIAHSPMLLTTHNSVAAVTNLTSEEIKGIYSGQISNWQEVGGE
jgi:phosphate transport system substrate-binding protein